MKKNRENFPLYVYLLFSTATVITLLICVSAGSVNIPLKDTYHVIINAVFNTHIDSNISKSIILSVRLPRVICVALVGAALSLSGGALQGLLRNPLADGFTLGVSSGASLGAILAITFGITLPGLFGYGTAASAMLFAFLSIIIILYMANKMDSSISTNTIILIGIIFNMLINSMTSLLIAFAGDHIKSILFWMMGSLSGTNYINVLTLLLILIIFGTIIFRYSTELNAFAIGEDNARHIGINVKKVKLMILISASALIGVCVSVGGIIGFVGLVMPHITRMIVGPNHKRLLPAVLFTGAIFLMAADLFSRTLVKPMELPIGIITSFTGSIVFIYIFYKTRKVK